MGAKQQSEISQAFSTFMEEKKISVSFISTQSHAEKQMFSLNLQCLLPILRHIFAQIQFFQRLIVLIIPIKLLSMIQIWIFFFFSLLEQLLFATFFDQSTHMKERFAFLGFSDLIHKTQVPQIPFALTSYGSFLQFSKELWTRMLFFTL